MLEYDFVGDTLHNRWLGVGRLLENHIPRALLAHNIARLDNCSQECVTARDPAMSWIKSLLKRDIFLLFLLRWGGSARNNKSSKGLNASGKLLPSLHCVFISQPKYCSHINVNGNPNTDSVRCVTRGVCPAWKVSHKRENYVPRLQNTAQSIMWDLHALLVALFPTV